MTGLQAAALSRTIRVRVRGGAAGAGLDRRRRTDAGRARAAVVLHVPDDRAALDDFCRVRVRYVTIGGLVAGPIWLRMPGWVSSRATQAAVSAGACATRCSLICVRR